MLKGSVWTARSSRSLSQSDKRYAKQELEKAGGKQELREILTKFKKKKELCVCMCVESAKKWICGTPTPVLLTTMNVAARWVRVRIGKGEVEGSQDAGMAVGRASFLLSL